MSEGQGSSKEMAQILSECNSEFDSALESDFNTSLALNAFFKLVKAINRIAASDSMTKTIADLVISDFERMCQILGLQVQKVTERQRFEITEMINQREALRSQKKFQEADKIRDQIHAQNIVLLDHKNRTVWMKKEKILADP
jgi:cysteinyl-tRNA synthetase